MKNNSRFIRLVFLALFVFLHMLGCAETDQPSEVLDYTQIRPEHVELATLIDNILARQDNPTSEIPNPCTHPKTIYKGDDSGHWSLCLVCKEITSETEGHFTDLQNPFVREPGVGKYSLFVKKCAVCKCRYKMIITEKTYGLILEEYGKEAS